MTPKNNKKYNNFSMTLDECETVFDAIDELVIVDENKKIKYISPELLMRIEQRSGLPEDGKIVGLPIEAIHPSHQMPELLQSDKDNLITSYITTGVFTIARMKKVYKNRKLIGAVDYDLFPNEYDLKLFLQQLLNYADMHQVDLSEEMDEIKKRIMRPESIKHKISGIIGSSESIRRLKDKVFKTTDSNSTVLITGETGSGKELFAHAIHNMGPRGKTEMVEVNCAAIPESLFESEMFGYEEGSFTGAKKGGQPGKFELANKGTLFLDEVDQLPYHIQPKLLRALQEKSIDRIGSKSIPVDVRIIAATNKNLKELVRCGKFREDLYYRLNVVNFDIPPLRERTEDIPELVAEFINKFNKDLNLKVEGVSDEVIHLLQLYSWPGNVRELYNIIERTMNETKSDILTAQDFRDFFDEVLPGKDLRSSANSQTLEDIIALVERNTIVETLEKYKGNKSKTAEQLGLSRPALYYKIEKYGL